MRSVTDISTMRWAILSSLLVLVASECSPENCKLPECSCFTTEPPSGIAVKDMPQFVTISFDGTINDSNMEFFKELLYGRKNKNGCKVAATFYVRHEYLNYAQVHELYAHGNEIGVQSVSQNTRLNYWTGLNSTGWEAEIAGLREMISIYGNISKDEVAGMRAPYLQTGGDVTFAMLQENGFLYDTSFPFKRMVKDDPPAFPYTLDHNYEGECTNKPCPDDKYPGLWHVPLNLLFMKTEIDEDVFIDIPCPMVDKCLPPEDADSTFEFLKSNFEIFYSVNRAPFPLFLHEAWLKDEERKEGFLRFIDWLLLKNDVFIVNIREVIEYMRDPKPVQDYQQRRCQVDALSLECKERICAYDKTPLGGYRMMRSCVKKCPRNYPWLHNPEGL